jgi:hypothetical protein
MVPRRSPFVCQRKVPLNNWMRKMNNLSAMKYLIVLALCFPAIAQSAKVYVVSSPALDATNVNIPARAACLPGTYGPMCGARGAETASIYSVSIKARIEDSPIWLSCELRRKQDEKHCGRLMEGKTYPAAPKGNDKLTVWAWANPMFHGDMSKAKKLEFNIRPRTPDPDETMQPPPPICHWRKSK